MITTVHDLTRQLRYRMKQLNFILRVLEKYPYIIGIDVAKNVSPRNIPYSTALVDNLAQNDYRYSKFIKMTAYHGNKALILVPLATVLIKIIIRSNTQRSPIQKEDQELKSRKKK